MFGIPINYLEAQWYPCDKLKGLPAKVFTFLICTFSWH